WARASSTGPERRWVASSTARSASRPASSTSPTWHRTTARTAPAGDSPPPPPPLPLPAPLDQGPQAGHRLAGLVAEEQHPGGGQRRPRLVGLPGPQDARGVGGRRV